MDHNLEVPLTLDGAMEMDFDHPGDIVVSHADITLDSGTNDGGIPMEFENIENQSMLMDTENEEIIVPDFMGDQFTLQEYSESLQTSQTPATDSSQQNALSQPETMIDLQFDSLQNVVTVAAQTEKQVKPKYIAVKAASVRPLSVKKTESLVLPSVPRQVAIAPKPMPVASQVKTQFSQKQHPIAPKPLEAQPARQASLVKKMPIVQAVKGNVLGFGKQLIMMPTQGAQKFKLITSGGAASSIQYVKADGEQAQLIATKNINTSQPSKPFMTKFVQLQAGQQNSTASDQPAVITKILPASSASQQAHVVTVQPKTVPISVEDKMFISSPSKQTIGKGTLTYIGKNSEIFTVASPTKQGAGKTQEVFAVKGAPNLLPTPAQGTTTKRVVITATNPNKNFIVKTNAPSKPIQVVKDGNVINLQRQKVQLHQINVPGKGMQYIRVLGPTPARPASCEPIKVTPAVTASSKTLVFTNAKGNVIQMSGDKLLSGQPPPLVFTGNAGLKKVAAKPQQKLVRIAPAVTKTQVVMQSAASKPAAARAGQSLLAPRAAALPPRAVKVEAVHSVDMGMDDSTERVDAAEGGGGGGGGGGSPEDDSKAGLRALIEDAVGEHMDVHAQEVEVAFETHPQEEDSGDSEDQRQDSSLVSDPEHPLIVIPACFDKQDSYDSQMDDSQRFNHIVEVEAENIENYHEPRSSSDNENVVTSSGLTLRPRKACNCTKSQCLKLYCDCFANGEFCNRCNCNNCHNNIEHEELRQKAIRGCLDRNPNAFRPKIGKAKQTTTGQELVRRHNKGCNCKRSGCLKNYCECYEAKIACSGICKCLGCRNVEDSLERARRRDALPPRAPDPVHVKQPCSFITGEVIEAVTQCMLAAAVEGGGAEGADGEAAGEGAPDPLRNVIEEFSRCLQDIISASHQAPAAAPALAPAPAPAPAAAPPPAAALSDGGRG